MEINPLSETEFFFRILDDGKGKGKAIHITGSEGP
jgi:hypothetical protein